jgi:hypothetical protein
MKIAFRQVDQQLIQSRLNTKNKISFIDFVRCSLLSNEDDDEEYITSNQNNNNKKQKITAKEEGQMIRARAFLNRLDRKIEEKDQIVKKIR